MRIPDITGGSPVERVRDLPRPQGKKAVNLTVDAALLREARDQDINLSATLERALEDAVRAHRRERWLKENRPAIDAYNEQVDEHGTFADTLRSF
jgi:antitoxin CcdA